MISDHYAARLSKLDLAMVEAIPAGGNWRDIPETIVSERLKQIRVNSSNGGGSRSTYYGRLQWDRPAYTVSTYFNRPGNGCYIHPVANRLITIREAARLQSFPDSYRFSGTARERQQQVGNAVPPLLAYHLASMLPPSQYVDLFCGAGGLSLGFDWAGFQCVAAVDIDPTSLQTFGANRSGVSPAMKANLSDKDEYLSVASMVQERLHGHQLGLVVGGPPCQGFSTAGNNLLDDPRNQLVWSFVRFIEDFEPPALLMENVPALAWKRTKGLLQRVQQCLGTLGYTTSVIVAHAEGYGVPQLRRRLFLLGTKSKEPISWPVPTFDILEPAFLQHQPLAQIPHPPAVRRPTTVRDAIEDLPFESQADMDSLVPYRQDSLSDYSRWVRGETQLSCLIPEVVLRATSVAPVLIL